MRRIPMLAPVLWHYVTARMMLRCPTLHAPAHRGACMSHVSDNARLTPGVHWQLLCDNLQWHVGLLQCGGLGTTGLLVIVLVVA